MVGEAGMYSRFVGGAKEVFPDDRRARMSFPLVGESSVGIPRGSYRTRVKYVKISDHPVLPLSFSDQQEIPHSPSGQSGIPISFSDKLEMPASSYRFPVDFGKMPVL
jgi:hypothetical protein